MTKANKAGPRVAQAEEIPAPRDESDSQIAVRESMDIDPNTGQRIRIGTPETNDAAMVEGFIQMLQEEADQNNTDSMSMLADLLRQSQDAQSVADALREKTTISGKDFVGIPFLAERFTIREGDIEDEEIPYYASIDAQHPNYPGGFVVNCGGMKILVHLFTLRRLNAFPLPLVITAKETKKGYKVLSFDFVRQTPQ